MTLPLSRSHPKRPALHLAHRLHGVRAQNHTPLEGGPNKAVKDLLRTYRGIPEHHARRAVEWLLDSLTQHPHTISDLIEHHDWQPTPTRREHPEPIGPQYGTTSPTKTETTYETDEQEHKPATTRPTHTHTHAANSNFNPDFLAPHQQKIPVRPTRFVL